MEVLARTLERSGGYRILRRLDVPWSPLPDELDHRLALFVDVETTGLNAATDEIIQFAAVPLQYDREGNVVSVHEPIDQFRDPGRPIPPEVTALTGIGDADVHGKALDLAVVERLLSLTSIVIAHNAGFDHAFLERLVPRFGELPWGCSIADVPWREEGLTTHKLDVLAMRAGLFYDAHRALDDCLAAVELLRRPMPVSGRIAMAELLARARRETFRIAAIKAPFARKDMLKARGYRWHVSAEEGASAWTIETTSEDVDAEIRFLREEVYESDVEIPVTRLTAYTRYTSRV